MINLEYLKIFLCVAKNKNITKAAFELSLTQPAVSKSIKNLEEQLNTKLLNRNKKGVTLTEHGEILYEDASKIFDQLQQTITKININNKKTINIAVGKNILNNLLMETIIKYNNLYPNVKINIYSNSIEEVTTKLKSGELDFAIGYYLQNIPNNYKQLKISKSLHPIFVCGKNYIELTKCKQNIKDLFKYPFIQYAKGSSTEIYINDLLKEYDIEPNFKMEILGTTAIKDLIKNGAGIGILTKEFIKNELNNKELFQIHTIQKMPERGIRIMYYKTHNLSYESYNFINMLTSNNQ